MESKDKAQMTPEDIAAKKKQADAEKAAGKTLTPEEKKAQRDAVNKAKAEKKALAAKKKQAKLMGEDEPII